VQILFKFQKRLGIRKKYILNDTICVHGQYYVSACFCDLCMNLTCTLKHYCRHFGILMYNNIWIFDDAIYHLVYHSVLLEIWETLRGLTQCTLGRNRTKSKHSKTSVQQFSGLHSIGFFFTCVLQELERIKTKITSFTIKFSL